MFEWTHGNYQQLRQVGGYTCLLYLLTYQSNSKPLQEGKYLLPRKNTSIFPAEMQKFGAVLGYLNEIVQFSICSCDVCPTAFASCLRIFPTLLIILENFTRQRQYSSNT
jgi:hypothetical protein